MKKTILFIFSLLASLSLSAQDADVKILAINDFHSHIEHFPKLAYLVDSIRSKHPDVLLFSAGDNRTGNPVNDNYKETNLPGIEMMNLLGFNMSTMGNHECDGGQSAFANTINKSNFPYVVANAYPHDTLRIHTYPYRLFEHKGLNIGVIGLIQLNSTGHPACLPANVEGIRFTHFEEEMQRYAWLRDKCDVYIALSHLGYTDDKVLAESHPELDLIIGGHSHDLIPGEKHNGVFISQAECYTKYLNEIDIKVVGGKVVETTCRPILVKSAGGVSDKAQALYDKYANAPELKRVVARAVKPFASAEEIGVMMTEAVREYTGADIALQNQGGIRINSIDAGNIDVAKILELDPYGNIIYTFQLTGRQLEELLVAYPDIDHKPVFCSGIKYTYNYGKKKGDANRVTIKNEDGSKFNMDKTYTVAVNSFMGSVCPMLGLDNGLDHGKTNSDILTIYMEKHHDLDFSGRKCITVVN